MTRFLKATPITLFLSLVFLATSVSANYSSYSEIGESIANNTFDENLLPSAGAVDSPIKAKITNTFANRAAFDAAYPGSDTEDFEDNLLSPASVGSFSGPLNSATNNSAFATGSIMPGIEINPIANGGSNQLAALTTGFFGAPSTIIGANSFSDNTELSFPFDNVIAVAMDIYVLAGLPNLTVNVYDTGNNLQATVPLVSDANGVFFGIKTDLPISRIEILGDDPSTGELIDNISFARDPSIPTLSEWGTIIMILTMMALGAVALKRKRA